MQIMCSAGKAGLAEYRQNTQQSNVIFLNTIPVFNALPTL